MKKLILDDVSVECLVESAGKSFHPEFLFPDFDSSKLSEHEHWLLPRFIDHNSGRLLMSIHTYIIRTPDYICLVDTYGETNKFFNISKSVFIGGSLVNHGGQNPIEPSRHNCQIYHGPFIQNFQEIYGYLNNLLISKKINSFVKSKTLNLS